MRPETAREHRRRRDRGARGSEARVARPRQPAVAREEDQVAELRGDDRAERPEEDPQRGEPRALVIVRRQLGNHPGARDLVERQRDAHADRDDEEPGEERPLPEPGRRPEERDEEERERGRRGVHEGMAPAEPRVPVVGEGADERIHHRVDAQREEQRGPRPGAGETEHVAVEEQHERAERDVLRALGGGAEPEQDPGREREPARDDFGGVLPLRSRQAILREAPSSQKRAPRAPSRARSCYAARLGGCSVPDEAPNRSAPSARAHRRLRPQRRGGRAAAAGGQRRGGRAGEDPGLPGARRHDRVRQHRRGARACARRAREGRLQGGRGRRAGRPVVRDRAGAVQGGARQGQGRSGAREGRASSAPRSTSSAPSELDAQGGLEPGGPRPRARGARRGGRRRDVAARAVEQAELDLGYTEVRAPIAGRIGRLHVNAGQPRRRYRRDAARDDRAARPDLHLLEPEREGAARRAARAQGRPLRAARRDRGRTPCSPTAASTRIPASSTSSTTRSTRRRNGARARGVPEPDKTLLPGQFAKLRVLSGATCRRCSCPRRRSSRSRAAAPCSWCAPTARPSRAPSSRSDARGHARGRVGAHGRREGRDRQPRQAAPGRR